MRGRPRKTPEERLHPVSFNVPLPLREAITRQALKERTSESVILRDIVSRHFRIEIEQPASDGPTLGE